MNIGDLVMKAVADFKGFVASFEKEGAKAGEKGGAAAAKGFKKNLGAAKGGLLAGLGLGAGLGVFNMAVKGIGMVTDAIGDATKAAIEDEQSQVKLKAALRANIPAWDENTAAIEKTIGSRMKLGFSDDEQRNSLAGLTAATHDSTKALDLQRIAMDLARFTGKDLASAGQDLIKVQAGQFRVLKTLGIQVRKGITSEEALAEIQKVVAGQAEDYSNTVGGKLLANQVKFDEAMENFGYKTMPIVADALTYVTDLLDPFGASLDHLMEQAASGIPGGDQKAKGRLKRLGDAAAEMGISMERAWELAGRAGEINTEKMTKAAAEMADEIDRDARVLTSHSGPIQTVSLGLHDMADDAEEDTDRVVKTFGDMVREMEEHAGDLIDQVYDPLIQHAELAAIKQEMADLRRVISSSKSTKAEKQDAKDRLLTLSKNADETRLELLKSGNLTAEETGTWLAEMRKKYKKETGKAKIALGELIKEAERLARIKGVTIDVNIKGQYGSGLKGKPQARGGPVTAGTLYEVNEGRRIEYFRPDVNGTIIPASPLGSPSATAAGNTYQIAITNPVPRAADDDIGRMLRRHEWLGF